MKLYVLLISVVLASMCVQIPTTTIQSNIFGGKLQLSFSDDIQRLQGLGKATALVLTVDEISIGKSGNFQKVLDTPKTIDLIQFSPNNSALLVDLNVDEGTYDQIKLKLSNASVKIYNYDFNIFNKTFPLVMTSSEVIVNYTFSIEKNKALHVNLDMDIPQSVSKVSAYFIEYRLNPVFAVSSENQECGNCIRIT